MKQLKYLGLLIVFVLSMVSVNAQDSNSNVAITLERTPCFGSCPVYVVTIYEDGTVVYNGQNFVSVMGEQTTTIDPEMVGLMVESIANAGYFEWEEEYTNMTVSDLPTVISSVTRDGETHRIVRYAGDNAPLALPYIENWIDEMANTGQWTGVQSDITTIFNGLDSTLRIATIQQYACFGFCPVYSAALYEDGTVIYTGLANVDEIGVQVLEADPALIANIAQIASLYGYFSWQDSYELQLVTDHPTIISSIQWEEQFKRIVRYDGDPNAPIGLVRVEDSIAQLVLDLVASTN